MTIGLLVSAFNAFDGSVIIEKSGATVDGMIALARENPDVRKGLLTFITATAYGQLIGAVAMMLVPIAANHGLLPAQLKNLAGVEELPPIDEKAGISPFGFAQNGTN